MQCYRKKEESKNMNSLYERLQLYGQDLLHSIHPIDLVINLLLVTLLSWLLAAIYVRYGRALANRKRFAANFMPLALTTMLVMLIVKSSLTLSLGLVGALSIVRFRAAIKEPEELSYLFIVIGLGLAAGANQPFLALILFGFLSLAILANYWMRPAAYYQKEGALYLELRTDLEEPLLIEQSLKKILGPKLQLRRMDALGEGMGLELSFSLPACETAQLQAAQKALQALSANTSFLVVAQTDLPL